MTAAAAAELRDAAAAKTVEWMVGRTTDGSSGCFPPFSCIMLPPSTYPTNCPSAAQPGACVARDYAANAICGCFEIILLAGVVESFKDE